MKNPSEIKNRMKNRIAGKVLMLFLMIIFIIACEKTKYTPPADHTVSKDGFMHKSGLDQPLTNCVSCHGSDLTGGTSGVSCYECHGYS